VNELTASQRAALENVLATVIEDIGVDVFLTRPLVLPDETHFPDHFAASCWGVAGLLARLLRYAGLENAHVHVDDDALVHAETGPKDGGNSHSQRHCVRPASRNRRAVNDIGCVDVPTRRTNAPVVEVTWRCKDFPPVWNRREAA